MYEFVTRLCFFLQGLSTYIKMMLSTQVRLRSRAQVLKFVCSSISDLDCFQALLSAIGVGEKSATVIGATFQVSFSIADI